MIDSHGLRYQYPGGPLLACYVPGALFLEYFQ